MSKLTSNLEGPVLVMDDEPDYLTALVRVLQLEGLDVYAAATPEEAITKYLDLVKEEKRPRLAILDVAVSRHRTGFDVARSIWECDGGHQTCLVLLTAYAQEDIEDDLMTLAAGGDAIIKKGNVIEKTGGVPELLARLAAIQAGFRNTVGPRLMDGLKNIVHHEAAPAVELIKKNDNPKSASSGGSNTTMIIAAMILSGVVAFMCFQSYWMGQLKAENQATSKRFDEFKAEIKEQQDRDRLQQAHDLGLNSVYIQQLREQFAEFKGARR